MTCTSNHGLVPRAKAAVFALVALAGALPATAFAQESDYAAGKPVCLDINRIDHTEILNDHQILFHMRGRKIWVNNLTSRCSTMDRDDGFVWDSAVPRYCDNLETIRVIRTGQVCLLGKFSPYEKPAKPS